MIQQQRRVAMLLIVWFGVGSFAVAQTQNAAVAKTEQAAETTTHFAIGEFQLEGNTLLQPIDVELALTPFLGPDKSIEDVEAARQALEQRYRAAGFPTALVDIPEQEVTEGLVRLRVVEARIESLRVTGTRYFSPQRIRAEIPSLAEGGVPYIPEVQGQIGAVNRKAPNRSVTPLLKPGKTPGTLDVELRVTDQLPVHANMELTNRYSDNTTHTRLTIGAGYDNLWQREHSFNLQFQTAPRDTSEVKVWSGTYLWRFERSDKLLVVYGVNSNSQTATIGEQTVIGKGKILGTRVILPLPATANYFPSFSLGVDYKDFKESVVAAGSDTRNTPISYANWAAQYNVTLRTDNYSARYALGASLGLRGVLDNDVFCYSYTDTTTDEVVDVHVDEFQCKRDHTRANYFVLRGDVDHTQQLVAGWAWRVNGSFQAADEELIGNEQYALGGADSVRGYLESQALGDFGYAAQLEIHTPSFANWFGGHVKESKVLLFADGGHVRVKNPLGDQQLEFELYGVGAGWRLQVTEQLKARLDVARPLRSVGSTLKGDNRLHFSLAYEF